MPVGARNIPLHGCLSTTLHVRTAKIYRQSTQIPIVAQALQDTRTRTRTLLRSTIYKMEPTPSATQSASSELRKVDAETDLATNPKGDESLEKPKDSSYSTIASNAANSAAETASSAAAQASATATSVKDNVFSMFGGGPKKEKKEEEEVDEPSGSSKAKKAEGEDDEVGLAFLEAHFPVYGVAPMSFIYSDSRVQ